MKKCKLCDEEFENKEQDICEYYLYGTKLSKEDWERKRKYS